MSSEYIEEELSAGTRDLHRALASLQEELEAVDYYHQRAERSKDDELTAIMLHNRDEEMEHASMLLEYVRRRMPAFDAQLRRYLFTETSLAEGETAEEAPRSKLGIAGLSTS